MSLLLIIPPKGIRGCVTKGTVLNTKKEEGVFLLIEQWLADERRRAENQLRVVDNGFVLGIAGLMLIFVGIAIIGVVPMNILTVGGVVLLAVFVMMMAFQHFMITSYIEGIDSFYLTTMHRIQEELRHENKKARNKR